VPDADATISALATRPAETVLMLDFDGSLAPIVGDPMAARPLPEAVAVLQDLAVRFGRIAIVSGRPVEFLEQYLPIPELVLSGLYGLDYVHDGVRRIDPRVKPFLPAIEAAARDAQARLPGLIVERKSGVSVTLHWRTAVEREPEVRALADELAARYELDAPLRGRRAVELRPPVPVDKGSAVRDLARGFAVGAFAGDDAGDLPAFAALQALKAEGALDEAIGIGVLSPEAPAELEPAVDVTVGGPHGLVAFLTRVRDQIA
jgi:trehalose 6-phosphate phosphatase